MDERLFANRNGKKRDIIVTKDNVFILYIAFLVRKYLFYNNEISDVELIQNFFKDFGWISSESSTYTKEELAKIFDDKINIKVSKSELYNLISISKNTYKKYFNKKGKMSGGEAILFLTKEFRIDEFITPRLIGKKELANAIRTSDTGGMNYSYNMLQNEYVDFLIDKEEIMSSKSSPEDILKNYTNHDKLLPKDVIAFLEYEYDEDFISIINYLNKDDEL